ncbi:MAG: ABC transporter permease [Ruminococcus sp.]|uniref:ABC transporter permease n=1 Tax=Schaedlerella arabinosiphila TaxID=2044587 RepID=A0A3R8JRR1_9FIRM|nr:ABC transporter permease [Schaedlerella arabinosiphila]MCI8722734.1 ABC transporter permease [Ruminococcus sp.]RRK34187.1 ABC transporter permease [Schaedlerella arabinosiphila]
MWRDYSSGLLKNNHTSVLSVRVSAFISALLLSLLCGLFYNMWKYEVERIEREEGGWHSRLIGEISDKDLEVIKNFGNVKDAVRNESGKAGISTDIGDAEALTDIEGAEALTVNEGAENSADLYFYDLRNVFSDTPRIAELVGISPEKAVYNYPLLAMYLIRDSRDTAPRLVFPMFIIIMAMASMSLVVIIHNAFAVSMNARVHQFGIFSSIGATPRQIRTCLLQEAAALCAVPVIAGNLLGIAGAMGLLHMTNVLLAGGAAGRHKAVFGVHPLVLAGALGVTVVTIWISAWLPAKKLSRLTPLEAIRSTDELQLKRRKNSPILARLFGVEGELAGNALKAQKKALRTASFSLALAFMAYTMMQCFFSLSGISTRETYFERYQNVWDIMVTVKDAGADIFEETKAVRNLAGVKDAAAYQKASAKRIITEEEMSEDMKAFGGFSHASGEFVTKVDSGWLVNAPILVMDDESFLDYCKQIGIAPRLDGAVIRNQIRDVTNPDFRHPDFMPYLKQDDLEKESVSILRQSGNEQVTAEIPVLSYAEEVPALREEYAALDYYELVHFIPVSLWEEIKGQTGGGESDFYIRVIGKENAALEELNALQDQIEQLLSRKYTVECENRIQEYETNRSQIWGVMTFFGALCVLLALIGIGNIFSNTLGFVRQRKREFARYMSIGLTPEELRKMFCIEALAIAGRPILITLPPAVLAAGYMLKLSYVDAGEFLAEAPLMPIIAFMLAILGAVGLAYFLAWRNVRRISLAEVLRDDTMM